MASVTKNPLIINSALYVYNWFLSLPDEQKQFIADIKTLDKIKTDEMIISSLKKNFLDEKEKDYEGRLEESIKHFIKDNKNE